jgi:ribosome assembly protein YihI (activator of Der GTPase)
MPTQTGEQIMTTEQQIKSAIDTLNEALELMQKLGFVTEGDEDETL